MQLHGVVSYYFWAHFWYASKTIRFVYSHSLTVFADISPIRLPPPPPDEPQQSELLFWSHFWYVFKNTDLHIYLETSPTHLHLCSYCSYCRWRDTKNIERGGGENSEWGWRRSVTAAIALRPEETPFVQRHTSHIPYTNNGTQILTSTLPTTPILLHSCTSTPIIMLILLPFYCTFYCWFYSEGGPLE